MGESIEKELYTLVAGKDVPIAGDRQCDGKIKRADLGPTLA
jgi:hypothetical protein